VVERHIYVPRAWEQLSAERLRGTLLVIGAPDVGKTTFAQYLYRRLCAAKQRVAYLDGDPGQSTLGPATTMTLSMGRTGDEAFPPQGQTWRHFLGAISPRGHMLPLLVGAGRLTSATYEAGAETVVYDTCGLVDPACGGLALKLAKVDLLRPAAIFALQRGRELEPLLLPLRRSNRVRVIDLRPVRDVRRRDVPARQAYRAAQFARYFATGKPLAVDWGRLAVFRSQSLMPHRLVALEDVDGFALGLGIVLDNDVQARHAVLYTPLASLAGVDALRLGDVIVDPQTFRDQRINRRPPADSVPRSGSKAED
jgi:polynucleotide 5'-hydroxyl-kinase GRC3/NOL9